MLPLLCALPAITGAPQGSESPSLGVEIAALIERTNALQSLHLVYELEVTTEEAGKEIATIDIVYRAPWLARLRVVDPRGTSDTWADETHLYTRSELGTDDGLWHRAALPQPALAASVLAERFPGAGHARAIGTALDLALTRSPQTGEHGLRLVAERGDCLLRWLAHLERKLPEVAVEGESFVLADEDGRYRVSRATGFLESLEVTTETKQLALRLQRSTVDEPLAPDLVTVPEEASAVVLDQALTARTASVYDPDWMRRTGFLAVQRRLDSGRRAWDEATRADWRAFLDALHRERIEIDYAGRKREREEYAEKLAAYIRSQRAKDDSFERTQELEERIAQDRARLEGTLRDSEAKYLEKLHGVAEGGFQLRAELLELEREVVAGLWNELLREPLLAGFDASLEAAMGR